MDTYKTTHANATLERMMTEFVLKRREWFIAAGEWVPLVLTIHPSVFRDLMVASKFSTTFEYSFDSSGTQGGDMFDGSKVRFDQDLKFEWEFNPKNPVVCILSRLGRYPGLVGSAKIEKPAEAG